MGLTTALSSVFRERADRPYDTKPIAMFLGAGMDIAAGGITFQTLKKEVVSKARSIRHLSAMSASQIDELFEEIVDEELEAEDRGGAVSSVFSKLSDLVPSEGHLLLALLAKYGAVDRIITTNFDTLIEKAEAEIGERIFQIYAPGLALPDTNDGEALIPPKPVYLKLHGDLEARRVTHLSQDEISNRAYGNAMASLLAQTFKTHRIFFVGYGGYDAVVANAIEEAGGLGETCYWVNPVPPDPSATVVLAIGTGHVRHVASTSDDFMRAIVKDTLSQTDLFIEPTIFVESLIAERIKRANARFLAGQDKGSIEDRAKLIQPRPSVDEKIADFRRDRDSSLALLVGPSGVGKSAIAVRLCDSIDDDSFPSVLAISAKSMIDTDVARRIVSELETGAGSTTPRLFDFSAWLAERRCDLLVIIDGLNEFSRNTDDIVRFLRAVIDALHRVAPHGRLKMLVSLREETWSEVLPLLDFMDLKRVLWSPGGVDDDSVSVISVGLFDEEETRRAFEAYARKYRPDAAWRATSPAMRRMMADPFVLKEVMTADVSLSSSLFSREVMSNVLRSKLGQKLSTGRVDALITELTARVLRSDGTQQLDVYGLEPNDVKLLLDSNILRQGQNGQFLFFHDRTYEFFLARALESDWPIREFEDLALKLDQASHDRHLRAALLACFVAPDTALQRQNRRVLEDAVSVLQQNILPTSSAVSVELFVTDLISETARQNPRYFVDVLAVEALANQETSDWYARRIVRAAVLLPDEDAFSVWIATIAASRRDLQIEAEILLYDRTVQRLAETGVSDLSFLRTEPLNTYFFPEGRPKTLAVARLLLLTSRLGPDNLSRREWAGFTRAIRSEVRSLVEDISRPSNLDSRKALAAPFVSMDDADANRFLFNARSSWLETRFQSRERANAFEPVIEKIEAGQPVDQAEFLKLVERAGVVGEVIDFVCLNLCCALSYRNDPKSTLEMFDKVCNSMGPTTPADLIDLFLSCLFVSIALNGDDASSAVEAHTRSLVERCPQLYLVNPGEERSRRHGRFLDDFDQQFEDGFNPLAFYFYHAPSAERRAVSFRRSLETDAHASTSVPFYGELLERFEQDRRAKGIIRIVHALGQMVSVWPYQGLTALAPLTGRQEPTVRRAMKRVLAEAYARFPVDCELMLERVGAAFSSEDLYDIRCAYEPRLAQRTLEQVQWCRMLIAAEACFGRDYTVAILKALALSSTWWEAMADIVEATLPLPPTSLR